ncbi:MAG: hypothetical protein HY817_02165 [Candidatus Abawacabacteria bacterium]|nr:hypothetical protein [Candidatus Abawacabacteria bacterium]
MTEPKSILLALNLLGVSTVAGAVYLKLLQRADRNLSQIAKELSISRPHLYKLIGELEEHELLHFEKAITGDTRIQLNSPSVILQKVRDNKNTITTIEHDFIKVLPELISQFDQGNGGAKVKMVSGSDEFLELLMSIAEEEKRSMLYFGSIEDFIECVTWTNQEKWMKARVKAGIHIQALLLESSEAYLLRRNDKKQLRDTRILDTDSAFISSFHIFANKVIFWQPKAKLAILIEDQHITQMLKAIFFMLWNATAKK